MAGKKWWYEEQGERCGKDKDFKLNLYKPGNNSWQAQAFRRGFERVRSK